MASTYAVKRPVAWLGGIILLALVVLAIVLPLTVRRTVDVYTSRVVPFLGEYSLFSSDADPLNMFESIEIDLFNNSLVASNVEEVLGIQNAEQRRGQINVYAHWDRLTGPESLNTGPSARNTQAEFEERIRAGTVGAFLNIENRDTAVEWQRMAIEGEGRAPLMLAYDTIHGYATIFPVNLGMASAFDREMIYEHARIAARESLAVGINWNYNPMLDVGRDPRWGRISEGGGEDAYLVGVLGAEYIKGYQHEGMAACIKHVGAYGVTQAGRDYTNGHMGRLVLFNQYFEAYRRAFRAKPLTAMASFNAIFGMPSHGNPELMTDILREHWGFDGFVVADWAGPTDMIAMRTVVNNITESGKLAIHAGVDMNMSEESFWLGLTPVLNERAPSGRTYQEHIDLANRRVLAVKERMGLFRTGGAPIDYPHVGEEAKRQAQIAAEKSAVLLKNEDNSLPFNPTMTTLLVGGLSEDGRGHQGSWSSSGEPWADEVETVHKYFTAQLPETVLTYRRGYNKVYTTFQDDYDLMNEAIETVQTGTFEQIVIVVGEDHLYSGEGASRTNLTLSGVQLDLVQGIWRANGGTTPRAKIVVVYMAGRPLIISWEVEHIPALLYAWNNGHMGGPAIFNLVFGNVSPGGKLPVTIPRSVGQIPIFYQFSGVRGAIDRELWDVIMDPPACVWGDADRLQMGGRCYASTYIDSPISPQYYFGHGLTYSSFEYSNPQLSTTQMSTRQLREGNPILTVGFTVTRTGRKDIAVTEIVQIYVRDVWASVGPTWKNLRGFTRVSFPALDNANAPNDSINASVELDINDDFGFYDENMNWVVEPGRFEIMVAKDAYDETHIMDFHIWESEFERGSEFENEAAFV